MTTSLQGQLRRLTLPQTSNLVDQKRRVSILFDVKEAATKDKRTIYELGLSGLHELVTIESAFGSFEQTLFDEASINLERGVEPSDVNNWLDRNIEKFLRRISPYFLLRPAHLCLEWLLRRFQINDYNRNALLGLALPYHETNIFIKVLQTIHIRKGDAEWEWLRSLQKAGLPIPRSTIVNRASSDNGFFSFVCTNTIQTIKEFGAELTLPHAHINFYTGICVGALGFGGAIQEWQVSTLLPSLLKGLNSESIDYVSASYIIAAQLVSCTQLTTKLCNALIERIISVKFENLRSTAVLLLICIYDKQTTAKLSISETSLLRIVKENWFVEVLSGLVAENISTDSLTIPLIKQFLKAIQEEHSSSHDFKLFMEQILSDIKFANQSAQTLIGCFLDAYKPPKQLSNESQEGDIIELDSDDDMYTSSNFLRWYSEYLQKLENKYTTDFDAAIKIALRNEDASSNQNEAIKIALKYRLNTCNNDTADVYQSLFHYSTPIRLHAIQTLVTNLNDYKKRTENYQILRECLSDRISDENVDVVAEILKLPTTTILDILGHEKFIKRMLYLLNKVQFDARVWGGLTKLIVRHVTSLESTHVVDSNLVLLMLMPIIFPDEITLEIHTGIVEVMRSSLQNVHKFLKYVKTEQDYTKFNAIEYKRSFLDIISGDQNTINPIDLFNSVQQLGECYFQHPTQLSHFFVLMTACLKEKILAAESMHLFKTTLKYCSKFNIKYIEKCSSVTTLKQQFVPQQLVSDFVISLSKRTNFDNLESQDNESNVEFFVLVFEFLTSEAFKPQSVQERLEWMKTLKEFLDEALKTAQAKVDFFTNFSVRFEKDNELLEMWILKLLNTVFQNKNKSYSLTSEHVFKLMVHLNSNSETLRRQVLETLKSILRSKKLESYLEQFVERILDRSNEIEMDSEQFPLILFTILNGSQQKRIKSKTANRVLDEIIKVLCCSTAETNKDMEFKSKLLKSLKHINSENIIKELLPFASESLEKWTMNKTIKILSSPYSDIFQLVIERITQQTINQFTSEKDQFWPFLEKIFNFHDVFVVIDGKLQPIPNLLLNTFDEFTFEKLSTNDQTRCIQLITKTIANAENDLIFVSANKLLKKCHINCETLAQIIENMVQNKKDSIAVVAKRKSVSPHATDITTADWKEGVVLLELLENKKKLLNTVQVISPLFELLKACVDTEDQHNVEYIKQLTLSLLLHCCKCAESEKIGLNNTTFRIDYVVQCLRASQNPQTHNNALLLLSHCANIVPQKVLTEIVAIFTFMGSSVVRHDDAFSFHIINNVIISIVPILVGGDAAGNTFRDKETLVVPVLKVFSDIMLDVPEHRRLPLYTKLIQTLGADQYLWMFLCVVFEAHVVNEEKQRHLQKKFTSSSIANNISVLEKISKRIEIVLDLVNAFEAPTIIETCIQLLGYFQKLPLQKEPNAETPVPQKSLADTAEQSLFDANYRTAKQLRHYRYTILQFVGSITSSPEFLKKIEKLSVEETTSMRPFYQNLIIKTLSCVPAVNGVIEKPQETSQIKYWKVILNNLHDVLDNAISLLTPEMFLLVVTGLMKHKLLSIRKKVIELLNTKLQHPDNFFASCNTEHFHNLIKPLTEIVESILENESTTTISGSNNEMQLIQQTAVVAIRLLTKLYGLTYIEDFKKMLNILTKIVKKRLNVPKMILGAAVLTIIEIASNLKAHSLALMPKYMPQLIEILYEQAEFVRSHLPENICVSIVTGIQKLIEALPLFLGPYIVDIVVSLSCIFVRIGALNHEKDPRSTCVLQKFNTIWLKIATYIPVRNNVPNCRKAYTKLFDLECYVEIGMVMELLKESIRHSSSSDLANVQSELICFFLQALEFRRNLFEIHYNNLQIIAITENNITDAIVSWVLKLSETSFRPIFNKIYDWAIKRTATKQTIFTYFLLTSKIAAALKSLFVLFAYDLIEDAARILNECNTTRKEISDKESDINSGIIKSIFTTLRYIFVNDSKEFINSQRFDILLQPIVDQLENELVLKNAELQSDLIKCITHLAVAVSNDVLWKQLNHQVLLKTRTNVPEVRIFAFNCCVEIARKLGDDFSPLLPETVPFIAELFEDENPRVEKNTRKSVQELEHVVGESLQKYL